MHLDPIMPPLVSTIFVILIATLVLKILRQPYVVAYLLAGVLIGPQGLGVISDRVAIDRLGAIGILLLLFFVGMEVSPHRLLQQWKIPIVGTLLQIAASVGCAALLGWALEWALCRILLIGFVISLSSTAVVLKILEDRRELNSKIGNDILGVLLTQDLLLVPMLVVIGLLSGQHISMQTLLRQGLGGCLIAATLAVLLSRQSWRIPFSTRLRQDHELQVFWALGLCFGCALITGLLELSAAMGAFVAGIYVGASRETEWFHRSLHPFRVVFVAMFFLSMGMLVDLKFLLENIGIVAGVVLAAMLTNTLINSLVFRVLGERWSPSFYGGSLLAPIGEFSFVLAAMGRSADIINDFGYQLALSSIYLSLMLSSLWLGLTGTWFRRERRQRA